MTSAHHWRTLMRTKRAWAGICLVLIAAAGCGSPESVAPVPEIKPVVATEQASPPWFDDVTAASGVRFAYRNGEEANHYAILESLGGGVAVLDYNGDGLLDIYIPGGGWFEEKNVRGYPGRLLRNAGEFRFEDVTSNVGLDRPEFYSHAASVGDYDRDGWPDLAVSGWGPLALFHNEPDEDGGRRFVEVGAKAGFTEHLWACSGAWADFDGDGWSDLYLCQYGDWSFEKNHPTDCFYRAPLRDVCPPRRFQPLQHKLYRNNQDGTFSDVSVAVGLRTDGKGLGVVAADFNDDRRPDIYVVNDTDENFLYINRSENGQLKLEEKGLLAGVARDDRGSPNGSMGTDVADFNNIGMPSLFCTNYENEYQALYLNKGREFFQFASQQTGIAAVGQAWVSWGIGFADFHHRGWEDILIVNGHATRYPGGKAARLQRPILFENNQGKFTEVGTQCGEFFRSLQNARGLALADLDNDGGIDFVVSRINEPIAILKNIIQTDNHWLGLELVGKDHRDIVGATVHVESGGRKLSRYAKGGGSYASSPDRRLVFGLGGETKIDRVEIVWPWGAQQTVDGLTADRYWRIREGDSAAVEALP